MSCRSVALLVTLSLQVSLPRASRAQAPSSVYDQVGAAFEQGQYSKAEELLRAVLRGHPEDARALGLTAVILDAQKRYAEAEGFYERALKLDPRSASLLNNFGNHYLEQGDLVRAREAYLKVVAVDPAHPNANLHLAQMSVAAKKGVEALKYLGRLPAPAQAEPAVELLRAQALDLAGKRSQAQALVESVEQQAGSDPRVSFSVGMVLVGWQRYAEAEKAFTRALDAAPTNFDLLYNLGLAATRAGHLDRALEIFQIALKQRPDDVDCLYNLARVYAERGQDDQAVILLVRAQQQAPNRPEIALFLAHTSERLGYYADTAVAYDQYLKLRPNDDDARRERGFALARGAKLDQGLVDLHWYVQKYPKNARGLYELGIAETVKERPKALERFNRAVALDPKFTAARFARAVLLYQDGKAAQTLPDLISITNSDPKDYRALDQLGVVYLTLGKTPEALAALDRAAKLAPDDSKVLSHFARALLRAGRTKEGQEVLAKFQKLQLDPLRRRPYGGLFDFLKLPPAEQQARYMENLQRQVSMNPRDPVLKARLGKALLAEGKTEDALAAFRDVRTLTSEPTILRDCAEVLMGYQEFELAREFLARVVAADPTASDTRLDFAIATFHAAGAAEGLVELDKTPPEQRQGDYFLLRAQILDAMGRAQEAAQDLNRGFAAAPTRADLYFAAALFLIKHERLDLALSLLQKGTKSVPDSPELLLTQAIAFGLARQFERAFAVLAQIESRWPEWGEAYLIHGIVLVGQAKMKEAKVPLQTAIALGVRDPLAFHSLALADMEAFPTDVDGAYAAIQQALQSDPSDPYVQSLAGKIDYTRKDYNSALQHLTEAIRLWPDMVEAHQRLAATYRALGDEEKAIAELQTVLRIKQQTREAAQAPPSPMRSLLFSVRPPGEMGARGAP